VVADGEGRRDAPPVDRSAGPPADDVVGLAVGRRVRVRDSVAVDDVVELLEGDSVGDVEDVGDGEDEVGVDVGLDDSLVEDDELLGAGWESRVDVDVPVGRDVTRGALLRPPKAGGGKSSTSVPFRAPFMNSVHTRTGMLPPVTSDSPPSPLRDSCTA
jgi:hypothetical protein